ncbi:unnamed protein product [Blepharisma stoltei]|uniref:Uncharacterized protein n=1 Tax=Blepharisma stoltei TaxID=1481888 RepID=A0AAU9K2A3_9CILI|nr:unnamed protein product [Blepharisma stoltei]
MSVYSGFSTRAQEMHYAKLTEKLIELLQAKLLFFIRGYNLHDDSWGRQFYGIYKDMTKMELQKYLAPRYSESCKHLAGFLYNYHNRSLDEVNIPDYSIDNYLARLSNTEKHYKFGPNYGTSPTHVRKKSKKIKFLSKSPPSHKQTKNYPGSYNYYGHMMDSFLRDNSRFIKKPIISRKKILKPNYNSPERSEDHDFWLIDDKIHLFET